MTTIPLGDLANLVGGHLSGDPALPISGAAIIRDAHNGDITLADRPQLADHLSACQASAVLVPPDVNPQGLPYVTVDDVHQSFSKIVEHFQPPAVSRSCGVSAAAHVSRTARLGADVVVHPGASIGEEVEIGAGSEIFPGVQVLDGCRIGSQVKLFPNAVLYERTQVGDRVLIHAGAVIGAYGFGYRTVDGQHILSAQLGNVIIEDDVEIGAGTTIDRGTYGPTLIGAGTKLDNQVMIAHNCRIGRHNLLCAQVALAGSCTTGDYVVMAGAVGVRDHITIGDGVVLGAKSGVMHDIPAGEKWVGYPATPERDQMVKQAAWSKLPEMRKQFKALQKQVAQLAEQLDDAA